MRRTSAPRVSLDKVIETMYETGKDMNDKYRETSRGGLAIKVVCGQHRCQLWISGRRQMCTFFLLFAANRE